MAPDLTRGPRGPLLAAGVAALGGLIAFNTALVGGFYDDGLYAGLAIALGRGLGYVHPHLPGTPAAIHYPPLYPIVLAPLFATLPVAAAAIAAKFLNVACSALTAWLITRHAERTRLLGEAAPPWLAPMLVGAAAVSIPALTMGAVLFSEPLFGVLLALAVISADRIPDQPRPYQAALIAGAIGALAVLARSLGVALVVGIPLWLSVHRSRPLKHALVAVAPIMAAGLVWAWWTKAHTAGIDPAIRMNYGSYAEVIRVDGLRAFGRSAPDLLRPLGALMLGWLPSRPLYYLFGAAAAAVGVVGLTRVVARSSVGWTLVAYFAILAIWPYLPDRFVWAVLPWLALVWAAGAVHVYQSWRGLRIPLGVVSAVLAICFLIGETRGLIGQYWKTQAQGISDNFRELLPGLTDLPDRAVLASDDEALIWLYQQRQSTVPFYIYSYRNGQEIQPTPAQHRAYLERQGVTHILFSGSGSGSDVELEALMQAYPRWLDVVRRWPKGQALLRVVHAP